MNTLTLRQDQLEDVIGLWASIPEFDTPVTKNQILERIQHVPHLVLTAYEGPSALGFKIGYLRDGVFYSWLGAVRPQSRQLGVAKALADEQEKWARFQGYDRIRMKTRNCFPEMLIMALRRGFKITSLDKRDSVSQNRIWLEKML